MTRIFQLLQTIYLVMNLQRWSTQWYSQPRCTSNNNLIRQRSKTKLGMPPCTWLEFGGSTISQANSPFHLRKFGIWLGSKAWTEPHSHPHRIFNAPKSNDVLLTVSSAEQPSPSRSCVNQSTWLIGNHRWWIRPWCWRGCSKPSTCRSHVITDTLQTYL